MSAHPRSAYFHEDFPPVRISIDGTEFTGRVVEFCRSKGWARVLVIDADGKPTVAVNGRNSKVKWMHGRVIVWLATDSVPPNALTPLVAQ